MFEALIDTFPEIDRLRDKRFLMVTGAGKSGTTWVQKILDSHPEIHCRGEAKFGYMIAGLSRAFKSHAETVWMSNRIVYGKGDAFYKPHDKEHRRPVHQLAMALMLLNGAEPIPPDVKYVGDKDPGYAFDFENWVDWVMPEPWVVHIVRDCRDVIHSHRHHRARTERDFKPQTKGLARFVDKQAAIWAEVVTRVHAYGDKMPDRYHLVRYEELLADPEREIAAMLDTLEVAKGKALVADIAAKTDFGVLSGGRALGEEDRKSFYRKGGSGDWREWFEKPHHDIVRRRAGAAMAAFGYELD